MVLIHEQASSMGGCYWMLLEWGWLGLAGWAGWPEGSQGPDDGIGGEGALGRGGQVDNRALWLLSRLWEVGRRRSEGRRRPVIGTIHTPGNDQPRPKTRASQEGEVKSASCVYHSKSQSAAAEGQHTLVWASGGSCRGQMQMYTVCRPYDLASAVA